MDEDVHKIDFEASTSFFGVGVTSRAISSDWVFPMRPLPPQLKLMVLLKTKAYEAMETASKIIKLDTK